MPFESGDDYLEILSAEEIPIAERLGINEFLTVDFRVNISIKRDFCVDPEQVTPSPSQVQVYFNDVLRYTQACNVDLELILKNQDGDLINDATFTGYEIVVTQGGGQVTININGVLWDVINAGETENIIVRQSSGATQVGSKQGQYYRIADSVVTLEDALGVTLSTTNVPAEDSVTIVAPSARVSNSDDSYDVNVVSGGDLELPDITVSNSDDSYSVTYPSVQDVELPDETINIVDENGNPLDSITFPVYTDPNIDVSSYCPPPVGATLMKTGQTTSYRTGDDGDLEEGRATDFFTLANANPFGNTNRFTDELGGQTYANDWVIDWSTYNNSIVLGYYRIRTNSKSWDDAIDECLANTFGTFSGCRLPNVNELCNLIKWEDNYFITYAPFNFPTGFFYNWSSTTYSVTTTQAIAITNVNYSRNVVKTSNSAFYGYIPVRTFTVTGTTLT